MDTVKRKRPNRRFEVDKYKTFRGSKSEGQGFADKRKKKIHYEYLKMLKKERKKPTTNHKGSYSEGDDESHNKSHEIAKKQTPGTLNLYSKSQKQFSSKQLEKEKKKKEALKKKREVTEALNTYKDKKSKQFKKLCKKTHKGQPVMRNQIELLLNKIQSSVNQT